MPVGVTDKFAEGPQNKYSKKLTVINNISDCNSNNEINKHAVGCEPAQLAWKCTPIFSVDDITRKLCHTCLFLAYDQGAIVGLYMQDYKSPCGAVTICAILVNTHTHRQTDSILTNLYK